MLSEYPNGDSPILEQGIDGLLWEDFAGGNYQINPNAPDPTEPNDYDRKDLWVHIGLRFNSVSEDIGDTVISQDNPKVGVNCLSIALDSTSAPYLSLNSKKQYENAVDEWLYVHEVVRDEKGLGWTYDHYNRMEFHMRLPSQVTTPTGGVRNGSISTYHRSVGHDRTDQSSSEQGRLHYYHRFYLPPSNGRWIKVIMDEHPNHQEDNNGSVEIGNQPYPTLEANRNLMDSMTRFWITIGSDKHTFDGNPVTHFYDKFKFYKETRQENEEQVYTISGFYDPSNNRLYVGWQRNKNDNDIIHEVRYSFVDIHDIGWNAATVAPNGSITPPGFGGYSSMAYDNSTISMGANTSIFVAVKPQNSNLFKQIQLDLT